MAEKDPTETTRRAMIENDIPALKLAHASALEEPTWSTDDLRRDFEVLGFLAPFVIVRRKVDGVKGCLEFNHSPRVYFNWVED